MDLNTHFRDRMPNAVTLPQHFKNHGYYSYGIGKVFHHPTGYDALSWSDPQPELTGSAYFPPIAGDKRTATEISPSNADYFDRNTTQMAIEKLKELKDTSFFLAVGLYKPHLPFNAPVEFWNRYNRADIDFPTTNGDPIDAPGYALRGWWEIQNYTDIPPKNVGITEEKARELIHGYRASVSYSDNHVGMLLHALDELGLDKNTIVVLWGDHGYKLYDYRDWCKHTLMEIDTRVPLIFRIPHMPKQGDATEALVESIDIYPTLADLCNIPLPQNTEGRSFKNVLLNPEAPHREAALSLYPRGDSLIGYSMRTEGFRFTKWSSSTNFTRYDSLELYDLDKDPRAFVNMAYKEKYSRVTSRYLKSMDSLLSGRAYSTFTGLDITGTK
jgi:arylsulfatase A-like enzyme